MPEASIAIAILTKERLQERGRLANALFRAIVAVDKHHKMGGGKLYLGALVVAGGCANAPYPVT